MQLSKNQDNQSTASSTAAIRTNIAQLYWGTLLTYEVLNLYQVIHVRVISISEEVKDCQDHYSAGKSKQCVQAMD